MATKSGFTTNGPLPPEEPEPPQLSVHGITVRDFNLWKHSPVTRLFRQYLRDKAADVQAATMMEWLSGGLELAVEQEARSTINAYETMASLMEPDRDGGPKLGEIASFYADFDKATQARTDGTQDPDGSQDQD